MKRRLHEAYDQLTMSPACAERIETMLKRQLASPGRRRYVRTARPGGSPWAAAAVVGLVLLISGLGASLAFGRPGDSLLPSEATAPAQETTQPQETTALFEAAGISFQYPADWVHSAYQGEDGGADAFSDPQTQGTVFTLRRSEAWLVDLTLDTEGYQRQLQQTWPDAVVLELEKTTLGGVEANRVEYVCSDGGASHLVTRYEAVTNAVGYVFEYFHTDVQETGLPQQVRALFDSVHFGGEAQQTALTLTQEEAAFLEQMCLYMPDWADEADLDQAFWRSFLFASLTCPTLDGETTAQTIAGEAEYLPQQGLVKIAQAAVLDYVRLAMGRDLSNYDPGAENPALSAVSFYLDDGYFYAGVSDFGAVRYAYRELESQTGQFTAIVDVYLDGEDRGAGYVELSLAPADNSNGFIITGKATHMEDGQASSPSELAETFVSAYFSGDEQTLRSCLAADFSGAIEVYPDDAAQVPQVQEIYVTGESASYSVTFLESDQADSYTYLVVELVNNGDGWGVSFYALEK